MIEVLSRLPAELPVIIGVVIHRGALSNSNWSVSLGAQARLRVVEPTSGDPLVSGIVDVAPSDCHMTFDHGRVVLDGGPKEHHTRPAVDPLFISAAHAYAPASSASSSRAVATRNARSLGDHQRRWPFPRPKAFRSRTFLDARIRHCPRPRPRRADHRRNRRRPRCYSLAAAGSLSLFNPPPPRPDPAQP